MRALLWMFAGAGMLGAQTVDQYLGDVAQQQWDARKAAITKIRTPQEVRARQQYIHAKLLEEIGGFPEKTPLNARITGTVVRNGYRIEKLIFESQPRFYVTANVYVPTTGGPRFPAVLGTAGHSVTGKAEDLYQRVWISLARRGFVVLAYDPPGQGERLEYFDAATGKSRVGVGTPEHMAAGVQCLLTGSNIARYFIWDGVRAFDYLLTRPDVDGKRIGVAGNSGGGTQSAYLAALEPRLAAAAPSCYLTTWEKLWTTPGPQDSEQVFANFLRDGLDFADFAIAFAPKPFHMAAAVRDYFPIEGARAMYEEARAVFRADGAPDHMGFFEFDDTHGWSKPRREATYRWFARWLQNRQDDGVEPPDLTVEAPKTLECSATGQLATSLPGGATVQSLNAARAEAMYAKRAGAGGKNLADLVRQRLAAGGEYGVQEARTLHVERAAGYRREDLELKTKTGIEITARLFVPEDGKKGPRPAVLQIGEETDAAALARNGTVVLAIAPSGWSENEPRREYSKLYQTAMRALLVGKPLVGIQTREVLHAFEWLWARPDIERQRITVEGKGNAEVLGLYAAVLEPRIPRVVYERTGRSYLEMVREKTPQGLLEILVPGVLEDFDLPDVLASVGNRAVRRNSR